MATEYTQFSVLLRLDTPEQALKALAAYEARQQDANNAEEQGVCDASSSCEFQMELDARSDITLVIYSDETGSPEDVFNFVSQLGCDLALTGHWAFEWANTCSRPRINSFSGGGGFIDFTDGTGTMFETGDWVKGCMEKASGSSTQRNSR